MRLALRRAGIRLALGCFETWYMTGSQMCLMRICAFALRLVDMVCASWPQSGWGGAYDLLGIGWWGICALSQMSCRDILLALTGVMWCDLRHGIRWLDVRDIACFCITFCCKSLHVRVLLIRSKRLDLSPTVVKCLHVRTLSSRRDFSSGLVSYSISRRIWMDFLWQVKRCYVNKAW